MYAATEISPSSIGGTDGFIGFWSACRDDFDMRRFPFSLDRTYLMDMTGEMPRFVFAGNAIKSDNNRDLTGYTIDAFDNRDGTTRILKDHMLGCLSNGQPRAWKVTANPCGRKYSFYKLYLPYPKRIVSASWVIADPLAVLTRTQRVVAEMVAKGYMNKQIADELGIVEGTAELHVKAIRKRLGARNRTEVAAIVLGAA